MSAFKNVPVVSTTARRTIKRIARAITPTIRLLAALFIRFAVLEHQGFDNLLPQRQIRLRFDAVFHRELIEFLSAWARGECMAGPLVRLSMRN